VKAWGRAPNTGWPSKLLDGPWLQPSGEEAVLFAYMTWLRDHQLNQFAQVAPPHRQPKGARRRYARERSRVLFVPLWLVGVMKAALDLPRDRAYGNLGTRVRSVGHVIHRLRALRPGRQRVDLARAAISIIGMGAYGEGDPMGKADDFIRALRGDTGTDYVGDDPTKLARADRASGGGRCGPWFDTLEE
jgi:hypothetical protein